MSWWKPLWQFLRELSGEAALERRMRCGCEAKVALTETFEGTQRCC